MVPVNVNGLALDVTTQSPVVILGPEDSDEILPIWIGHYEAWAIAMEMSGISSKRPLPHDLIKSMLKSLEARVSKVEIYELKEQTFYARISIDTKNGGIELDARPSDSIAIALKTEAPIFANKALFNLKPASISGEKKYDPEELKERLKKINPEDFGKYSL